MANIHIVGAGAIGLSFAQKLSQRHTVTVIGRHSSINELLYTFDNHTTKINAAYTHGDTNQLASTSISHCFICVKAYQLQQAFSDIQPYLQKDASVFISHNGMQDLNAIKNELQPNQRLYFISTSIGALKLAANHVKATGNGDTFLGACNTLAETHIEQTYHDFFAETFDPSAIHNDITLLRWQKLLVNIAINPLTAIHRVPNGALRKPQFAGTVINLLNEACTVAKFEGVHIPLWQALETAYQVMNRTQHNASSMLQDVTNRRTTEIDAICGYIVMLGKQHHIATPYNQQLLKQVKSLH
jgi:2-dehydropantoate 2-reductase